MLIFATIGGYDPTLFAKNQTEHYCKVIDTYYWSVQFLSIRFVSEQKILTMNKRGGNYTLMSDAALIDSGTSLMLFPEEDFNNILAVLKSYEKNCVYVTRIQQIMCFSPTNVHFPTIHLNLCGKELSLNPDDYMTKIDSKEGVNEYLVGFSSIKLQSGAKLTILGALFMKEYYTLFNQDDMKIGFVRAARLLK